MNILVINSGSSSIKYRLIHMDTRSTICSGLIERIGEPTDGRAVHKIMPGTDQAAEIIRRSGNAQAQAEWLPRLVSGEAIATVIAPLHGQSVLPAAPATLHNDRLSGTFHAVADGMAATMAVVLSGDALVLLDLRQASVTRVAQKSLDPTRPLARITCDGAMVEMLLPTGGAALAR